MATLADFKARLRASFGYLEDSSGTVRDDVNRLFQRTHFYNVPQRIGAVTTAAQASYFANSASATAATDPVFDRPVYCAEEACVVQAVAWVADRFASVTVSTSDNWTIEVKKRTSPTFSAQAVVATLTSATDNLAVNKVFATNACTVTSTTAAKTLARNDILTFGAVKNLAGALFRGGLIKITVDEA